MTDGAGTGGGRARRALLLVGTWTIVAGCDAGAPAPAPLRRREVAPIDSCPRFAGASTIASPAPAPVGSKEVAKAPPSNVAENVVASPDQASRTVAAEDSARDSQLTSGGFLATTPREAVDGVSFPIPDPLPAVARPVTCDVPPPPATEGRPIRRVVGKNGTGPGEFAYLRAIAGAADGSSVYVVDKMGRIQKLDAELHVRAVVQTPEIDRGKPTALYVARSGDLWVADTHYARVLVYGPDLALKGAWGAPSTKTGGFLFLRDARELGEGRILTSDYGDDVARIQVFERAADGKGGKAVASWGHFGSKLGEFARPMKLAIDEKRGEIWVCDSVNHRLQVLDLAGKPLATIGSVGEEPGNLKYPYDVSIDEDGRAWVAEFGNHRIQVFSRDGRSLATWGKAGRGEGQVAFPWGLALRPGGTVLVIDSGNDRIYELDRKAILDGKG